MTRMADGWRNAPLAAGLVALFALTLSACAQSPGRADSDADLLATEAVTAPEPLAVRTFIFEYAVTLPEVSGDTPVELWMPLPVDDGNQSVTALTITGPGEHGVYADPVWGNAYLHVVAPPSAAGERVVVRANVHRSEVSPDTSRGSRPLTAAERRVFEPYLSSDALVPVGGRFAEYAQDAAGDETDPVRIGPALYEAVLETMTYSKAGEGWGRGDALHALDVCEGNCTDFHALFQAGSRSLGVPAVFEIGFPFPAERGTHSIGGYHCWAYYYAPGIGWVPVDISEADKHPDKAGYFNGSIDENRIRLTRGRDLKLPGNPVGPVSYLVYPYAEQGDDILPRPEWSVTVTDLR